MNWGKTKYTKQKKNFTDSNIFEFRYKQKNRKIMINWP